MKTSLIKTKTASLAAMSAIALTAVVMSPAKGQTIVNYDFNSLTTGSLNGQDGWSSAPGAFNTPSQVATTPLGGPGGTLGLTNGLEDKASSATKSFFTAGTLSSSDTIVLTFEAIQVTYPTIAMFGIVTTSTPSFGIWNGAFGVRTQAGTFLSVTPGATAPVANHWYSFQSEWDLTANTATLYYKDLTNGDTNYTQLSMKLDGIVTNPLLTEVSLGTVTNPNTWTSAWVRVGKTGTSGVGYGTGYLDNLSVVVVPEPHTVALGALGLGMLMFRARRRASLAA